MDREELLDAIAALRRGKNNVRARQLMAVAKAVGRAEAKRGKHRVFEMVGRPPLPIPDHSRTMAGRTVISILDVLEEDLEQGGSR